MELEFILCCNPDDILATSQQPIFTKFVAKKLKLYSYIGIGKYLGVCQNFSVRGI